MRKHVAAFKVIQRIRSEIRPSTTSSPIGPVPAEFKSVYRLFLRTLSRSVKNHRPAFFNLRRLWRPVFRTAARHVMRLDDAGRQAQHESLRLWLRTWDQRVDGTLGLLANAGHSRGLPATLVRNLASLHSSVKRFFPEGPKWNPGRDKNSPAYKLPDQRPGSKEAKRIAKKEMWKQMDEDAYNPVGEAIKLAEGRGRLTLGRVFQRGYVP